ncbi:hypothetical protein UK23_09205 [Lentzea aerocolonigenes]|uniref:Uncharacterized protein n=1 Tax=Lentzea aerocolonigenes TaxID=68170 RepID=A0A0F0H5N0_LENAE|nr:hypothetical protein [Lentzea aerocolonigenes]KJK50830.1 hypothetical protein UK23_09205 [Lentzea aerocolonigenes]
MADRLFDHVEDSALIALGIDARLLPLVRVLTAEPHLEALESRLPAPQYDALVALAAGMTLEEAWQEVSKHLARPVRHGVRPGGTRGRAGTSVCRVASVPPRKTT